MKTLDELKTFAKGYRLALQATDEIAGCEDWVLWDEYDINFTGAADLWDDGTVGERDLHVSVYPRGWKGNLPDPLFSFNVKEK